MIPSLWFLFKAFIFTFTIENTKNKPGKRIRRLYFAPPIARRHKREQRNGRIVVKTRNNVTTKKFKVIVFTVRTIC